MASADNVRLHSIVTVLALSFIAMTAATPSVPDFSLHFDEWGRLVLTNATGQACAGVSPVRAFPLSDPDHWLSICDQRGTELVTIADPQTLPQSTRETLFIALAKSEFMPVVERIIDATQGEPAEWRVITNRGERTFVLKGDDDIRTLSDGRLIITDSDGVRYLILEARKLDGHSRRVLERFI